MSYGLMGYGSGGPGLLFRWPGAAVEHFPVSCPPVTRSLSAEGGNAGQLVAENERVDFIGALVGADRLQVVGVPQR